MSDDRDQDDRDLAPVGPEERDDPAERRAAPLLGTALEVARGRREAAGPAAPPPLPRGMARRRRRGEVMGAAAVRYQAVAVDASAMPSASSQRSASMAALQPSPAAVTAWR